MDVLVLGGSGLVGSRFVELCSDRFDILAPSHAAVDVLDAPALARCVSTANPAAILNLAAWADVDAAEGERGDTTGRVYQLNTALPERLAELCADRGCHLVHVSTDYVFDGRRENRPYREDDAPAPLSWYAQTKLAGEQRLQAANASATIARIEMPFRAQPHQKLDFARVCASRLRAGQQVIGVTDQRITPVFLDDAVEALAALLEQRPPGVVHLASADATTPFAFARAIAGRLGGDPNLIIPEPFEAFSRGRIAPRPQHPWLDISLFQRCINVAILRGVDQQLDTWAEQVAGDR
jgi:dTDP-4-dehydrorhamnose reductase